MQQTSKPYNGCSLVFLRDMETYTGDAGRYEGVTCNMSEEEKVQQFMENNENNMENGPLIYLDLNKPSP